MQRDNILLCTTGQEHVVQDPYVLTAAHVLGLQDT